MELRATYQGQSYDFTVNAFRDEEKEKFAYLILLPNGAFMLAEKKFPSGKWHQKNGEEFDAGLKDAIYLEIDNAPIEELLRDLRPIDQLDEHYLKSL